MVFPINVTILILMGFIIPVFIFIKLKKYTPKKQYGLILSKDSMEFYT